jgi:hypothetical protein
MPSIARDAGVKAIECEKLAAPPQIRQHYIELARDWWEMAGQGDQLEADIRDFAQKKN